MTTPIPVQTQQYAECVGASKRVRWDIDQDVLRGREFDTSHKFLPDSISGIDQIEFLSEEEARLSQSDSRPDLCEHLRPGGTFHQLQGS